MACRSLPCVSGTGLALVPVVDQTAKTTPTSRSAFSVAAGLVLTSSKNSDFHAGLLIGKDYLSRSDIPAHRILMSAKPGSHSTLATNYDRALLSKETAIAFEQTAARSAATKS